MNKKYEIDMCSGSVFGKMLLFALPLMCSSILQLLFNAADIVVVGRFAGDNALAAVGSNTALINLLTNLFVGLSVGTNVLTAQYYGAKRDRDLKETVHTSMLLSLYSGLLLTVVGLIGAPKLLELMQAPSEVLNLAVLYLRIYFLGMASMMVYNFGSAILRAVGDTKKTAVLSAGRRDCECGAESVFCHCLSSGRGRRGAGDSDLADDFCFSGGALSRERAGRHSP